MKEIPKEFLETLVAPAKKTRELQKSRLSSFNTQEELLIYLANLTDKKRNEFLKPWKKSNSPKTAGRPKKWDTQFTQEVRSFFNGYKQEYSLKSVSKAIEHLIQRMAQEIEDRQERIKYTDWARKKKRAIINELSKSNKPKKISR